MIGAAKKKSLSPAGLTALRVLLLLVVTLCLGQTRVWGFGITAPPASGVFESANPSSIGENYDGFGYDASDSPHAAKTEVTVIGRVKDLQNLGAGERSLLDRLPDLGSPKLNWKQNSGVLRQEMNRGLPIRDASVGDTSGQFLNAERYLLRDRGWTFDGNTSLWMPPTP